MCSSDNYITIESCEEMHETCSLENVVCDDEKCQDDEYIHIDTRAFCKSRCASKYVNNKCIDDIQEGDECVGSGSFCKDNNLYICEHSAYRRVDCSKWQRTCVDQDNYWSYCLDTCTKDEADKQAKKIVCANNYYDSSFNQSYDIPENSTYYIELNCLENYHLSNVFEWDWKDSFTPKSCPGICNVDTNTCKEYPDFGKSCSPNESDPDYYPNKCEDGVLFYCGSDKTVQSKACDVCAEYNGETGCFASCDPDTDSDSVSCHRTNEGMSYETDLQTTTRCVSVEGQHFIYKEMKSCEAMCDETTHSCGETPDYHIGDPCEVNDFWIRCQDNTHRFVCVDGKVASEECATNTQCYNRTFFGGPSNSTCE